MITNMNLETGIRYGFTHGNDQRLNEWALDDFEPIPCEEGCEDYCECETTTMVMNTSNCRAEYDSNSNGIIVLWSTNIKECALCSPCAPNGGDLQSAGQYKTYDLPKDCLK